MNWPRLKRRLCLQPYLIDPYRSISYREARRIWRKEGRPDALKLLEGARKKAGMTPEEWRALTGLPIKATRVPHSTALRRWAIACVFVLLASAFLACTAPGRAFAAKVYRTFTTIAENILNIRATEERDASVVEPKAEISKDETARFLSLDEAYRKIQQPLLCFEKSNYDLKDITVTHRDTMGLTILSKYTDSEGRRIDLYQRWPLDGQQIQLDLTFENAVHHTSYSPTGLVFDGAYVAIDRSYHGGAIQDSMLTTIEITPIEDLETIDAIIQDITYFE